VQLYHVVLVVFQTRQVQGKQSHLDEGQLFHAHVQSGKDQCWAELPLYCGALLEILPEVGPAVVVGGLVALAHTQSILHLLQSFFWLHVEDLLRDIALGLHGRGGKINQLHVIEFSKVLIGMICSVDLYDYCI